MNKIGVISLFLLTVLIFPKCGNASHKDLNKTSLTSSDTGKAVIAFKEYEHDFGKVAEDEKVSYIFTFLNRGTGRLVISSVTTSCGCTIPEYDTKPIFPGASGNIEVLFDSSGKNGRQTKTITVKSNASKPVVLLKITAEILTSNNN
jgi:hypothetical protein